MILSFVWIGFKLSKDGKNCRVSPRSWTLLKLAGKKAYTDKYTIWALIQFLVVIRSEKSEPSIQAIKGG